MARKVAFDARWRGGGTRRREEGAAKVPGGRRQNAGVFCFPPCSETPEPSSSGSAGAADEKSADETQEGEHSLTGDVKGEEERRGGEKRRRGSVEAEGQPWGIIGWAGVKGCSTAKRFRLLAKLHLSSTALAPQLSAALRSATIEDIEEWLQLPPVHRCLPPPASGGAAAGVGARPCVGAPGPMMNQRRLRVPGDEPSCSCSLGTCALVAAPPSPDLSSWLILPNAGGTASSWRSPPPPPPRLRGRHSPRATPRSPTCACPACLPS